MRQVNQAGINLIKKFEGLRLNVYNDAVGKATIGWGHLCLPGEDFSDGITLEEANEMLVEDVDRTAAGVEDSLTIDISDNQFAALVSFAYNLGVRTLTQSTLMALVNKGDFEGAADQFPKWCHAGGHVLQGLLRRRMAEQELFETVAD